MAACSPDTITLRDYEKRDFEALFKLDRLCFEPSIAYSRAELASFIEQRRSFTIVAEWNAAESNVAEGNADEGREAEGNVAGGNSAEGNGVGSELFTEPSAATVSHETVLDTRSSVRSTVRGHANPPRRPIAGFVTCHFQRQGYGHIITIDVHPDARRHHVGTLLIDAACERLRKMTAFMVVLEVAVNNHSALAFYDRYGFKRIKVLERYYSRDIDAIFMTKRL